MHVHTLTTIHARYLHPTAAPVAHTATEEQRSAQYVPGHFDSAARAN
jgi:hypothetical protein